MPKKIRKSTCRFFNHYIDTYDEKLIHFLRRISEGCYHRNLFPQFSIHARIYDDYLHRLRFFLPPQHLTRTIRNRKTYIHFRGDAYYSSGNYLIHSFYMKTLKPNACAHIIFLLQLLAAQPEKYHSIRQLTEQIQTFYDQLSPDKSNLHAVRNAMDTLAQNHIVEKCPQGKAFLYRIIKNPLSGLNNEDAHALQLAIDFYRNTALLEVPGAYLSDTLRLLYPSNNIPHCYQFKNNNFTRILDEFSIGQLLHAIKHHYHLKITKGNHHLILPIAIKTDYQYNRQYLICRKNQHCAQWRIDHLPPFTINPIHTVSSRMTALPQKGILNLRLRLHIHTDNELQLLREHILDQYPKAKFIHERFETDIWYADIPTQDPLELIPWLRTLHPYVEILDNPNPTIHSIRKRMINDITEALKKYNEPIQ